MSPEPRTSDVRLNPARRPLPWGYNFSPGVTLHPQRNWQILHRARAGSPDGYDYFIGDDNAALQQQFLDKAEAQRKPEVEPDSVDDDLEWEAMVLIAD